MNRNPVVVLGVAGCGKSTVASRLAARTGGTFLDADDFHPKENVDKMTRGLPLSDTDRLPWLNLLAREIRNPRHRKPVILACSALKRQYRSILRSDDPDLRFVYLKGSLDLIANRMERRQGHFMKKAMLESQFADLEEPQQALVVSIDQPVEAIVDEVMRKLDGPLPGSHDVDSGH